MYVLLLDEFGDFSVDVQPQEGIEPRLTSWRPICGYGGILLPAPQYKAFCEEFAAMRLIALEKVSFARETSRGGPENRITYAEFRDFFAARTHRLYNKSSEVKGSQIFSTSYTSSSSRSRKGIKSLFKRARQFIDMIDRHRGRIFYFGIDKTKSRLVQKAARPLIVELVRGVMTTAFSEARDRHAHIKVIFDHHNKDDETASRHNARRCRIDPATTARFQTRQEYSQEVILERKLYTHLKDPVFSVESHWSLGIQAADWVCALLGKTKSFEADPTRFGDYQPFFARLDERMEAIVTRHSAVGRRPTRERQFEFDFPAYATPGANSRDPAQS